MCYRAFEKTHGLNAINLSHVTHIGVQAFYDSWLSSVTFSSELKYIPRSCFYGCYCLVNVPLPESLEEIQYGAFYNCSALSSVTLPSHLKILDDCAFIGCKNLGNITFPDTLEYLGNKAFYLCEKAHFTNYLPDGLKYLGYEVFYKTDYIAYVYNYDNGRYISSKSNHFFAFFEVKDKTATSIELHEDTKLIAGEAFAESKLTSVTLPDGVIQVAEYTFGKCDDLVEVNIPETVTSISYGAFYECTSLKSVTLPNSAKDIGGFLFEKCSSLETVVLPDTLETIPVGMFRDCKALSKIDILLSVTTIEEGAFYGCEKLTTINYAGTMEQMKGIVLGEQWNYHAGTLTIHCSDGDVEVEDTDPYHY